VTTYSGVWCWDLFNSGDLVELPLADMETDVAGVANYPRFSRRTGADS